MRNAAGARLLGSPNSLHFIATFAGGDGTLFDSFEHPANLGWSYNAEPVVFVFDIELVDFIVEAAARGGVADLLDQGLAGRGERRKIALQGKDILRRQRFVFR